MRYPGTLLRGNCRFHANNPRNRAVTYRTRTSAAAQLPAANPQTRRRSWTYYAQRSLRAASTIAAVIGLIFLLSGLLSTLPRGGTSSSTSAGTSVQSAKNASTFGPARTNAANPATPPSPASADHNGTPGFKPEAVGTPVAGVRTPATGKANHSHAPPRQSQPSIPLLDLSTPLVRQVLGFSLFVLGVVGVLLTRRKQRDPLPT